ncbi:transcriptional regulator, MerR family [Coriobacterium glomerans PW2]|uniref:Transcriptional regulator, MerR family n=1 Tax=Coriobacterium glomerans (strain ATCC 49209 / DSM 20642 / JCM 10262 / PW2) TaxID=700015 RepID=F2N9Z7_CORGP|nr:MerR family transcriptional regulator [Coriobacterium glomerans]AEB06252.1 transcriptional regulator, MerR family [Coriobacterium glomerans PW2]
MHGLYEISEMARLFDITRQTLIFYDKIGLFRPARVNGRGYRFYAPTQIPRLRLICIFRDLGLELKEIKRIMGVCDTRAISDHLHERLDVIDDQIARLTAQRSCVAERLSFYSEVERWRNQIDSPKLMHFPERYVVFVPFETDEVDRGELHVNLMLAVSKMKEAAGIGPVRGWGTMLLQESLHLETPLAGAGTFVVVPSDIDPSVLTNVKMCPEGTYLCMCRWGMPFDAFGIKQAVEELDKRGLKAVGNAFDFCLLDTTSYNEFHDEDFCCIQIPVEL